MPLFKSPYGYKQPLEDSPPSIQEIVKKINDLNIQTSHKNAWFKACIICLTFTGARVSEVLQLRKGQIKICNGRTSVYPKEDLSNVTMIEITLITLKQREKNVKRTVYIPINEFNRKPLSWLTIYTFAIPKSEDLIFLGKTRFAVNKALKKTFGKDFYPHLFRKIAATTDGNLGMSNFAMKKKYGWSHDDMPSRYAKADEWAVFEQSKKVYEQLFLAEPLAKRKESIRKKVVL